MGQVGGSLKAVQVAGRFGEMADGVRLHLSADRIFHTDPAFLAGCKTASELLKAAPLPSPPRRVFFLAHVAFELALDAVVLEREPNLADDLYAHLKMARSEVHSFVAADLAPRLDGHIVAFVEQGYLARYNRNTSLAEALRRIAGRVDTDLLPEGDAALDVLVDFFAQLREVVTPQVPELLFRIGESWYNSLQVAIHADND